MKSQGEDGADGMLGRERVMGYLDEEAVQRDKVGCVWGVQQRPPLSPIGPFHPAGVWRLQRLTWVCSRS